MHLPLPTQLQKSAIQLILSTLRPKSLPSRLRSVSLFLGLPPRAPLRGQLGFPLVSPTMLQPTMSTRKALDQQCLKTRLVTTCPVALRPVQS